MKKVVAKKRWVVKVIAKNPIKNIQTNQKKIKKI
jgi:hypothetical protein